MALQGFDTIISQSGTKEDKAAIMKVLEPYFLEKELQEVRSDLPEVVEYIMQEVDKIALEKKRGKEKDLNTIFSDHVKAAAKKFDVIQDDYLEKLIKVTDKAEPFTSTELEVPEKIITKKLPHLSKDGYKGQSHRVFDKLLKLHGDKKKK